MVVVETQNAASLRVEYLEITPIHLRAIGSKAAALHMMQKSLDKRWIVRLKYTEVLTNR